MQQSIFCISYSQGKDVDKESRGKIVEPVEHWSPPYLNEVPRNI